jgi:CheY-like chemotaxis protein
MNALVVDDDQITRMLMRRIVEKNLGWKVDDAGSGSEAWGTIWRKLQEVGSIPYDICILDVMMPQGNGLEILNRIRAEPRLASTKVIICSAITGRTSLGHFEAFKPDGIIEKPLTVHAVLAEIKRVVYGDSKGPNDTPGATPTTPSYSL